MTISEGSENREKLRRQAELLGFTFFGVTSATPSPDLDRYLSWIESGRHGKMGYLARPDRLARREDLDIIMPGVKTLLLVGINYFNGEKPYEASDSAYGSVSRYAWGANYHDILLEKLKKLESLLKKLVPEAKTRSYVDTGPIIERSHAADAGLGFIGKSTMLINPRVGTYSFLGVILTDARIPSAPDHEFPDCGSCTRCIDSCPTGAITSPFEIDARRCISYLTIELKGSIPEDRRPLIGNRIYGCDVCQEVCPWNRFAAVTPSSEPFIPEDDWIKAPPLADILTMTEEGFKHRFSGMPIFRIGRERLVRNACIAAGNSGDGRFLPLLKKLAEEDAPLISEHAVWAMNSLGGGGE